MPTLRQATADDAPTIAEHRHKMFADNKFATEAHLATMDATFEPWVRERLADGRYIGLFLEENGHILAGAGIHFQDFAPHWRDIEPERAYLLNVYTASEARGHGYANRLMRSAIQICRDRGIGVVSLHASPQGRPIYEKMGFQQSDEMLLQLEP
jgi:GNAT superfamily N-acetyltransferase